MKWSSLWRFMCDRDARFAGSVVGAARADVEKCQRELGIVLPEVYVEFLLAMGVDTGRHHPFGRTIDPSFDRVLGQIPEEYDIREFFLIGWDADQSRDPPLDLFLDLRHSDGKDAELLMAENGSGWAPRDTVKLTVLEYLTWNAWRGFEAFYREANRVLFVHPTDPEDLAGPRQRVLDVLAHKAFVSSLPSQRRIDCLASPEMAAIVRVNEALRFLEVVVAADDESALGRLVERFVDDVPGTSVNARFSSIRVY